MIPTRFRALIWRHYRTNGRHDLPWRHTRDPYRILVSEVMLQQTQVERVVPFYKSFIQEFPTTERLASAPLALVLRSWQGLGYNRRAKMLQQAARDVVMRYDGKLPRSVAELESLAGIGPYTARAIAAFAYNQDVLVIETNIRTVILHHFFPKKKKVSDTEIEKILIRIFPKGKSRKWYSALMDYGAYLKRSGISHNARSKKYVKQSRFAGSLREARGALLRELSQGAASQARLMELFGVPRRVQMRTALQALLAEELVKKVGGRYALAD
ncbi:MAG: HhH-GPD family protein [Minisyncoccota bacterium]